MPTIAEQLTQLTSDRDDLVDNLTTKGITGLTSNDTFTELVPKVLDIEGPNLESKSLTITSNTTTTVTPTSPHNGLSSVEITTNIQLDLSQYFLVNVNNTNRYGTSLIKEFPPLTIDTSITNLSGLFSGLGGLTKLPIMDSSHIQDMSTFCQSCRSLTDISNLNTSSATNMKNMFNTCVSLVELPFIDTSHVTNMESMFYGCSNLVRIGAINTGSVTNMKNMFNTCTLLANLPLLDFSHVTNFQGMFFNCRSLTNASLNNLLLSLAGATSYTGTKTLLYLFVNSMASYYPVSTIQSLSNYQDFIDAGWSIGWS